MSNEMLRQKLSFVIYGDNEWRMYDFTVDGNGIPNIRLDVHGLKVREAKVFILNVVNVIRGRMVLEVIHGFNHGTAIRDMLAGENFSGRLTERYCPGKNPGMTNMRIAA